MDLTITQRRIFLADLNARMLEKNITQKELGKRLGIRPGQISLWLGGNKCMSIDKLILITNEIRDWDKPEGELHEPGTVYGKPEEPKHSLCYLIKKHLKLKGITQKDLADAVGTSQSRISEYIRGAVVPTLGVAARICKELQIDSGDFVEACSRL